ncbi:response regulator [Novosphingobium sp.]|uniref:response regulator n=1 Tax=Novosphingobium sp. TaxID=1874826 RepID=UPI0025F6D770|nr:response regulator [Novosphingobium sp.]
MDFRQALSERLPLLRRYARALSGSQHSGDAYVRELLEAAIADNDLRNEIADGRVALYRAFTRVWSLGHVELAHQGGPADATDAEATAQARLDRIPPEHRQALLLTTMEEFSEREAGEILGLEAEEVAALVARAVSEIDEETATQVLIIEDEPLIAMQLEALVSDLGHTVVATASTRTQAVDAFARTSPGLVLADIQLADQSSGIDAVEDILKMGAVPVVFVTAYPERLLTGERPEPTYLVTKPFREDTLRAAISQALFFGSTAQ